MKIVLLILLFILGACIGSFLCCQARRLHLRVGKQSKSLGKRSVCLSCRTKLKWYDNIPILSWLFLKGKCRKCHKKIGSLEIISEIAFALGFVALGTTIDPATASGLDWGIFVSTIVLASILGFLAIYDGAYGELPTFLLTISIICAILIVALKEWSVLSITGFSPEIILKPLASAAVLGGIYLILYLVSNGRWVCDGDWLLGIAIGLALADPWLALITLFLANLLACLVMAPTVKKTKNKKIYFGPFMVIAFIIVTTFADFFYYVIGG